MRLVVNSRSFVSREHAIIRIRVAFSARPLGEQAISLVSIKRVALFGLETTLQRSPSLRTGVTVFRQYNIHVKAECHSPTEIKLERSICSSVELKILQIKEKTPTYGWTELS